MTLSEDNLSRANRALSDDVERLRARIHEVAAAGDRRNAELQRRVAHYEAIRDRVNPLIERLGQHTVDERGFHNWGALAHPGSLMGFWMAFQLELNNHEGCQWAFRRNPDGSLSWFRLVPGEHPSARPGIVSMFAPELKEADADVHQS